jgi:hypothetical protein
MSGKGSSPRPYSVDQQTFADNWQAIFRKGQNDELRRRNEDSGQSTGGNKLPDTPDNDGVKNDWGH